MKKLTESVNLSNKNTSKTEDTLNNHSNKIDILTNDAKMQILMLETELKDMKNAGIYKNQEVGTKYYPHTTKAKSPVSVNNDCLCCN